MPDRVEHFTNGQWQLGDALPVQGMPMNPILFLVVGVSQARGRLAAADLNKQAAIIEAEAVAEQISRIGEKLVTHDLYLRWQWIKMMEDRDGGETIYVPTEANLPLLEATRLMPAAKQP